LYGFAKSMSIVVAVLLAIEAGCLIYASSTFQVRHTRLRSSRVPTDGYIDIRRNLKGIVLPPSSPGCAPAPAPGQQYTIFIYRELSTCRSVWQGLQDLRSRARFPAFSLVFPSGPSPVGPIVFVDAVLFVATSIRAYQLWKRSGGSSMLAQILFRDGVMVSSLFDSLAKVEKGLT